MVDPSDMKMETNALNKLEHIPLREQVAREIRNAILIGTLRAGEKIREHDLAEQLGVSRLPVREAIRILEQQSLVMVRPKAGTYVATLSRSELFDGMRVRTALETLAVEQALNRLSPAEWEALCNRLQKMIADMRAAVASGDTIAGLELDMAWHAALIEAAKNQILCDCWQKGGLPLRLWALDREYFPIVLSQWSQTIEDHERLLNVLRSGDTVACQAAIRIHILDDISET
jgi:DNA-binding GntR family transcriptional regulator